MPPASTIWKINPTPTVFQGIFFLSFDSSAPIPINTNIPINPRRMVIMLNERFVFFESKIFDVADISCVGAIFSSWEKASC